MSREAATPLCEADAPAEPRMPPPPPDITFTLSYRDTGVYGLRIGYRSNSNDDPESVEYGVVRLDLDELRQCVNDPDEYGQVLTEALFESARVREAWVRYRGAEGTVVRVRLELDEYPPELHRVRWEALHNPVVGGPLLADQSVWFSRYLKCAITRQIRPRPAGGARVLVAAAHPVGDEWPGLNAFDPQVEAEAVCASLRTWTATKPPLVNEPLAAILRALADGYDIFVLIAHGKLISNQAKLLLVDAAKRPVSTDAAELVNGLRGLRSPPRLVVLASCQSAGADAGEPAGRGGKNPDLDATLAPQLGAVGIPAVVAMLGSVAQTTAKKFVGALCANLGDGQIDKAAALARYAVKAEGERTHPDYWAPVLYTRLMNGRLWRDPAADAEFDWKGLTAQLGRGQCVPVLGPGVLDPLVGPPEGIAARMLEARGWAEADDAVGIPQAAQYVGAVHGELSLRGAYLQALDDELVKAFPGLTPAAAPTTDDEPRQDDSPLEKPALRVRQLLVAAAAQVPDEPHDILARLGCRVYLSTNPDDLLARALARRETPTRPHVFNWLSAESDPTAVPDDPEEEPTEDEPYVGHLFGHLSKPYSVVLSEDDHFRYLVGMTRKLAAPKPSGVNARLMKSGLLFLGFRLDDWAFRAFLQSFRAWESKDAKPAYREKYEVKDVAVQLNPDDGRNANPERVRRFLMAQFNKSRISIFWGTTQEFLRELLARWTPT